LSALTRRLRVSQTTAIEIFSAGAVILLELDLQRFTGELFSAIMVVYASELCGNGLAFSDFTGVGAITDEVNNPEPGSVPPQGMFVLFDVKCRNGWYSGHYVELCPYFHG
jgi:hypothetical protein